MQLFIICLFIFVLMFIMIMWVNRQPYKENFDVANNKNSYIFENIPNIDVPAFGIDYKNGVNLAQCQDLCMQNPKCKFVSHNDKTNECFLKTYDYNTDRVLGIKNKDNEFYRILNADVLGYDLYAMPAYNSTKIDEDLCKFRCRKDPFCLAYVHVPTGDICTMKQGIHNPDFTSSVKIDVCSKPPYASQLYSNGPRTNKLYTTLDCRRN